MDSVLNGVKEYLEERGITVISDSRKLRGAGSHLTRSILSVDYFYVILNRNRELDIVQSAVNTDIIMVEVSWAQDWPSGEMMSGISSSQNFDIADPNSLQAIYELVRNKIDG